MQRVCVVGMGVIGNRHADMYKADPLAELVGVCDIIEERADTAAARLGVPAFYDETEMLKVCKPNIVSITTGGYEYSSDHYLPTMIALEAGCHVLGEKPISNEISKGEEMVAKAKEKGLCYGINLNHRFTPAALIAKRWQNEGKIGPLLFVNMALWIMNPRESSPYFHLKALHPHSIDVMLVLVLFVSTIVGVSAQSSTATPVPPKTPTPTLTPTPKSIPATPAVTITPTVQITPTVSSVPTVRATPTTPTIKTTTQVISGGNQLELTVYNQNLALVKEQREITLAAGTNAVQISDIATHIDPSSVHFASLTNPDGTVVLEQNYEYDLVDTAKLLSKYIDQPITVRTVNGGEYSGTLLSGGSDIILDTLGGIKVIRQDQIQEYTFPRLPAGLITRPSLNWIVKAEKAGSEQIRITYLTSGLSWNASYVVLLAPDSSSLDLNGWITLQNDSGALYPQAKLKLVAGDINLVQQLTQVPTRAAVSYAEEATAVQERSFFEYHLYEVQRPVTVQQGEIKQIEFITSPSVSSRKIYVYEATPRYTGYGYLNDGSDYSDPSARVQVRLEMTNSVTNGLGIPLPQGLVRVYQQDSDGSAEFVGEDSIQHTPKDEAVSLFLGSVFDLVAQRKQVQYRQLSDRSAQESWEVTLRNHKQEPVQVQVIENLFRALDAEISASSLEYTTLAANRVRFLVNIEPNSEQVISYTVVYRW